MTQNLFVDFPVNFMTHDILHYSECIERQNYMNCQKYAHS